MERDNARCRFCGSRRHLHIHHVTLRSQGGDHQEHNLIVLCHTHHDTVHAHPRRFQPVLRGLLWLRYVEGKQLFVVAAEKELHRRGAL